MCKTTGDDDWCKEAVKSFDYIINPPKFLASQTALTSTTFEDLEGDDKVLAQSTTSNALEAVDSTITCWDNVKETGWLPYDLVQVITNTTPLTDDSWAVGVYPRDYLEQGSDTGVKYKYLQTSNNFSSLGYSVHHTGKQRFLRSPYNLTLEPSTCTGITISYEQQFVQPIVSACRFVCLTIFYGGSLSWAPASVGLNETLTESECHNNGHYWTNLRALRPMLLLNDYQRYADVVQLDTSYQQTPWENFTTDGTDEISNCKLVATEYCGIKGVGYPHGSGTTLEAINYYDILFGEMPATHMVIPTYTFTPSPPDLTHARADVRRRYREVFWTVFLTNTTSGSCHGYYDFYLSSTLSASVEIEWYSIKNLTGCAGMRGCEDFSSSIDSCNAAPGCIFLGNDTSAPTPSSAPIPLQTLQPIAAPPTYDFAVATGYQNQQRDAAMATGAVAIFIVFLLLCVSVFLFTAKDDENDEYQPFILG